MRTPPNIIQRFVREPSENRSKQRRQVIDNITINNAHVQEPVIYRRIGNTIYKVRLHFQESGETMEDKLLRLVQHEVSRSKPLREVS